MKNVGKILVLTFVFAITLLGSSKDAEAAFWVDLADLSSRVFSWTPGPALACSFITLGCQFVDAPTDPDEPDACFANCVCDLGCGHFGAAGYDDMTEPQFCAYGNACVQINAGDEDSDSILVNNIASILEKRVASGEISADEADQILLHTEEYIETQRLRKK